MGMRAADGHEIVRSARREDSVRRAKRQHAGARHSSRHREQVLLCHADVEESLRKGVDERNHVGVLGQIRRQRDDFRPAAAQRDQRMAERSIGHVSGRVFECLVVHGFTLCSMPSTSLRSALRTLSRIRPNRPVRSGRNELSRAAPGSEYPCPAWCAE